MKPTTSMTDTRLLLSGTLRPSIVGHLSREISRFTYYVIIHGGREYRAKSLTLTIVDRHWFNCGLEIPIRVTVTMDAGEANVQVIKRYKDLVNEHYKEPVNGNFDDVTASVLKALMSDVAESDTESETKEYHEDLDNGAR